MTASEAPAPAGPSTPYQVSRWHATHVTFEVARLLREAVQAGRKWDYELSAGVADGGLPDGSFEVHIVCRPQAECAGSASQQAQPAA